MRAGRPDRRGLWPALVFVAPLLTCAVLACGEPQIYVRIRPGLSERSASVALVVVSREPPPAPAELRGEIAFLSDVSQLQEALRKVRARARRMGGNLVAPLRCRPAARYEETKRFDFVHSERLLSSGRLHCYGKVYWMR